VLDGWWAEGYNGKNGWPIGINAVYPSYEVQDIADSNCIYDTLEKLIIPAYYSQNRSGISEKWLSIMKETIITNGGKYSTARMLVDYTNKLYMPLCNLYRKYYEDLNQVTAYNSWKQELLSNWKDIKIWQENNINDITLDAGTKIEVRCQVQLPNVNTEYLEVQAYVGRIKQDGQFEKVSSTPMKIEEIDEHNLRITVIEGKKNEIRIVLKHIGSPVKNLHRISYGPIKIGNMKPKEISEIDKKTIDLMLKNF